MQITRLFDLLNQGRSKYEYNPVLASKQNGKWKEFSIDDYIDYSNCLSYAFLALALKKTDKVATITNNRPEWNFVDMGLSQAGMVHVPIYPTISLEEYKHILTHSESRLVFVADKQLYDKIKPISDEIPTIKKVYIFNEVEGEPNWKELYELGKTKAKEKYDELEEIKGNIDPDDTVSIIYTSGTTGVSKGVMLSHRNFLSNVEACNNSFPLGSGDKSLSFLPLSHVYERMVGYFYQFKGVSIYYAESMGTIGNDLKDVKPTVFVAVPRVIEKTFDKILAKGKDLTGIKKQLFFWAVNLGYKYREEGNSWLYRLKLSVARKLIFSKWLAALGGKVKFIISGGASLQPRLAKVFFAAGVPIYEGYGLTETSPVIAVNHGVAPGNLKFGSVGPVVDNVEVKLAEDNEILMRGPSLMKGYYRSPEQTQDTIDSEGWFHTGDIGELYEGKFLVITDRKKEIFKLSNGKYVAPQVIENKLKESFFIEQAMVVGENEKFVSALISPNFSFIHDWCARYRIHYDNNLELITMPDVIARYQKEINELNSNLGSHEKIKRFRLVSEQWSPQTGELSPTLKLRRRIIYHRYEPLLNEIYGYVTTKGAKGGGNGA